MLQASSAGASSATNPVVKWFGPESMNRVVIGHSFSATSERSMDAHEHVYLEGNTQTHVYLVLSGVVGTYKLLADGRRQIVAFSYPGDMLGLDHPELYTNSAEALCKVRVRCIPINAIDRLMLEEPGFGQTLLRMASHELAETRDQLLSLGRKSAMEKLATFLLHVSRRNNYAGNPENTLYLPMKRCDIADFLGLTIETVSRNFTRLKTAGIIQLVSNSEIKVVRQLDLEAVADGVTTN